MAHHLDDVDMVAHVIEEERHPRRVRYVVGDCPKVRRGSEPADNCELSRLGEREIHPNEV